VLGSARASLRAALSKTRVQCAAARHSSSKHQRVKLAPVRCCDARCRRRAVCCADTGGGCGLGLPTQRRLHAHAHTYSPAVDTRPDMGRTGRAFDVRSDRFSARRELR
jgi:hypothetical protein